jgi:uncharacterized protein (TIGR03083 family)
VAVSEATRGPLSKEDQLKAIYEHSAGLAATAAGNLGAGVEHCPGWTVADLVWHLTEVQDFWALVAEERLSEPPDDARGPARGPDERLIEELEVRTERLVRVLGEAEGGEAAWTWAPAQQDVAFIRRHQVQEAAVHHWDAVNAAGGTLAIEPDVAADAVSEFLTFSVASDSGYQPDPPKPSLEGTFVMRGVDAGIDWLVTAGVAPGTVAFTSGPAGEGPALAASASDLLLWLYKRVELQSEEIAADLLARFKAVCFTD